MKDERILAALADLMELSARVLHARGYAENMFPAQWMALRYFAGARGDMRTASELARFQKLANGSVSRTVRTLVQKGLLRKAKDQPKGRAEIMELTPEGEELLKRDPSLAVRTALATLPPDERDALARALEAVLRHLSADPGAAE